ncbi:SPOR domain-containing protein [Mucilaginibacter sp. SG564]|uniref:HU domain-containing protein n=1 Tax=unclassified Mucilaginibacter TaxID=2617802 RepID=UPI001551E55A|nr:SPOR domain-containing protein [Mucilaginibacter sp. SG564]NOW97714.1 cell division protein FtsN [Mucilaginibacter sp. SG564]
MDIANYLSELLGRHSKVGVPGLGSFTQVRVNGYYNSVEGKLYPPGYQVQFSPDPFDDDTLVEHIAQKKNISLASSKYFTEKYITSLKQDAAFKEVPFASLGWFYTNNGEITFKAGENHNEGPEFYGLTPIPIKKLNPEKGPESPVPAPLPFTVAPQPIAPVSTSPAPTADQPEVYEDEETEEKTRSTSPWLIALIILVIIAAAAFGLYKYNPALFSFMKQPAKPGTEQPKTKPAAAADSADDSNKTAAPILDTQAKAISKPDTALKKTVAAADTGKPEYVIFAGSFKTQTKSNEAVKIYKSVGVDARTWHAPGSGKRIKVIIGSFATSAEAEAERLKLIKEKKISKDSYSQEINEKK